MLFAGARTPETTVVDLNVWKMLDTLGVDHKISVFAECNCPHEPKMKYVCFVLRQKKYLQPVAE